MRCFVYIFILLLLPTCCSLAAAQGSVGNGIAQLSMGDADAAAVTLYPLYQQNPKNAEVQYWLGRAYYSQRFYSLAAQRLGEAARRNGGNRDVALWHARALRNAGCFTEAAKVAAGLYKLYPAETSVLEEYITALALCGDAAGVNAHYDALARTMRTAEERNRLDAWRQTLLQQAAARAAKEPPRAYRTERYSLIYAAESTIAADVVKEIDRAVQQIEDTFGVRLNDFRVLLFSDSNAFNAYARSLLPDMRELHTNALTLQGVLILSLPNAQWGIEGIRAEYISTIRHEIAHLAIGQRSRGDGVPLWLNEGLACYFGGMGGMTRRALPKTPLSLRELDQAFLTGSRERQEDAYAQALAMGTVLVNRLNTAGIRQLLDQLGAGVPLPLAYEPLGKEPLTAFVASWPERYMAEK
ncbi:MAG: peptidase MA family metallohydrolase [Armatimonadota bacterium]